MDFDFITTYGGFTLVGKHPKSFESSFGSLASSVTAASNTARAFFQHHLKEFIELNSIESADSSALNRILFLAANDFEIAFSNGSWFELHGIALPNDRDSHWAFGFAYVSILVSLEPDAITDEFLSFLPDYEAFFHFTPSDSLHFEDLLHG